MNREGGTNPATLLRRVVQRFRATYDFDRLGNHDDPLDELIYIVLSTRTRGDVFTRTFLNLRERYPGWEMAARARRTTLEKLLQPAGLSRKKSRWLKELLMEIRKREGEISLARLSRMSTHEAESYLTTLPGIGLKTARCVLMYSLGRQVFPVDANVRRLFERLELLPPGVHYNDVHDMAQEMVPEDLRSDLHIFSIIHGRDTCLPRVPRCESCVLNDLCPYPNRIANAMPQAGGSERK